MDSGRSPAADRGGNAELSATHYSEHWPLHERGTPGAIRRIFRRFLRRLSKRTHPSLARTGLSEYTSRSHAFTPPLLQRHARLTSKATPPTRFHETCFVPNTQSGQKPSL